MNDYPIMGGPAVPWEMIRPHAQQAIVNHDQTLERLAERGGLSPAEAICVLLDEPLRARIRDPKVAHTMLTQMIQDWSKPVRDLTAEREAHAATRRELEALRERVAATLEVLAAHGCDCECDHHRSECDDDCVWCLGCRVEEALTKGETR